MKLSPLYESLSKEKIEAIFKKNPKFFNNERYLRMGVENGIFDFTLNIDSDEVDRYINGDYTIRKYKDQSGNQKSIGLFQTILNGDGWDLWDNYGYDGDWESALDYYVDSENEGIIKTLINKIIVSNGDEPSDHDDMSLQDLIEEFDEEDLIKNALRDSINSSESDSYVTYLNNELRDVLSNYGNIVKYSDEGISIEIDFYEFVTAMYGKDFYEDDEFIEELKETCDWDSECFFDEIVLGDMSGDKPEFSIDDRWTPDIDNNNFNDILKDRLSEVGYEIN